MIIGDRIPYERELAHAGFIISKVSVENFVSAFGFEAAPVFGTIDLRGELLYLGGYFKTSEAKAPLDTEILREIRAGRNFAALPLYGCAVSARLRKYFELFRSDTQNPVGLNVSI
jgi:hypothetical protein